MDMPLRCLQQMNIVAVIAAVGSRNVELLAVSSTVDEHAVSSTVDERASKQHSG